VLSPTPLRFAGFTGFATEWWKFAFCARERERGLVQQTHTEARLPCPHLWSRLQLEPDIHVVGILVMVQDLTKGISISGRWKPKVGRLLLLFLRPEHMAH